MCGIAANPAERGSQVAQVVKNKLANAGDTGVVGLILGLRRSPRGGHDNALQYSWLENFMDRRAWKATKHGAAKELDTTERLNNSNNPAESAHPGKDQKLTGSAQDGGGFGFSMGLGAIPPSPLVCRSEELSTRIGPVYHDLSSCVFNPFHSCLHFADVSFFP